MFLVVVCSSRHAEGYAISKKENNSKGFVAIYFGQRVHSSVGVCKSMVVG